MIRTNNKLSNTSIYFIAILKGNIKFLKHILQNIFYDSVQSHHVATENTTHLFCQPTKLGNPDFDDEVVTMHKM